MLSKYQFSDWINGGWRLKEVLERLAFPGLCSLLLLLTHCWCSKPSPGAAWALPGRLRPHVHSSLTLQQPVQHMACTRVSLCGHENVSWTFCTYLKSPVRLITDLRTADLKYFWFLVKIVIDKFMSSRSSITSYKNLTKKKKQKEKTKMNLTI